MTLQEFLFSFTFVFGVIYLLSHTKLFNKHLETFTEGFTLDAPKWLKLIGFWGSLFISLLSVLFLGEIF